MLRVPGSGVSPAAGAGSAASGTGSAVGGDPGAAGSGTGVLSAPLASATEGPRPSAVGSRVSRVSGSSAAGAGGSGAVMLDSSPTVKCTTLRPW